MMKRSKWLTVTPARDQGAQAEAGAPVCLDRLRLELLRRGIPKTACGALAKQIHAAIGKLEEPDAGRMLDAMALAFATGTLHARADSPCGPEDRLAYRLAEDLSSEVRKLDEIVKVLNAYLVRFGASRTGTRERRLQ